MVVVVKLCVGYVDDVICVVYVSWVCVLVDIGGWGCYDGVGFVMCGIGSLCSM